jgi:hypothetical protein
MGVVVPRPSGSTKRAPASGKPERAGSIRAKSFGLRTWPYPDTTFAADLDLVPNSRRQNGSIRRHLGLGRFRLSHRIPAATKFEAEAGLTLP